MTETDRISLVLFDMQNMTFGPYLADINKIIISVMMPVDRVQDARLAPRHQPGAAPRSPLSRRRRCAGRWRPRRRCAEPSGPGGLALGRACGHVRRRRQRLQPTTVCPATAATLTAAALAAGRPSRRDGGARCAAIGLPRRCRRASAGRAGQAEVCERGHKHEHPPPPGRGWTDKDGRGWTYR
jgi:hypothetical protein